LPQDRSIRAWPDIVAFFTRHYGDQAAWVLKDPMIARGSHVTPVVPFEKLDDLANFERH